jgi:uncharacterized protein (DUF2164 family)
MPKVELPKDVRDALARALSKYLKEEHDVEVEGFDAVFLLDFLCETLGPHFYNQGLADARAVLAKKLEEVDDAVWQLEAPSKLPR